MSQPTIVTDIVHEKVHNGSSYTVNYLEKAVVNLAFIRLLVRTSEASAHIIIQLECEGKVYFKTYSSPTVTNVGTGPDQTKLTLFNRFECLSNGNKTLVTYNPVFTGGIVRGNRMLPFGQGGTASGGTSSSRVESIICPNKDLIIEIQNVSGQARDLGIVLDWYEVVR